MSGRGTIPPARELRPHEHDEKRAAHELLNEIASELNYLSEDRLNPHAFFERRDMLVRRLRRLSKRLGPRTAPPEPTTVYRPEKFR